MREGPIPSREKNDYEPFFHSYGGRIHLLISLRPIAAHRRCTTFISRITVDQ